MYVCVRYDTIARSAGLCRRKYGACVLGRVRPGDHGAAGQPARLRAGGVQALQHPADRRGVLHAVGGLVRIQRRIRYI